MGRRPPRGGHSLRGGLRSVLRPWGARRGQDARQGGDGRVPRAWHRGGHLASADSFVTPNAGCPGAGGPVPGSERAETPKDPDPAAFPLLREVLDSEPSWPRRCCPRRSGAPAVFCRLARRLSPLGLDRTLRRGRRCPPASPCGPGKPRRRPWRPLRGS